MRVRPEIRKDKDKQRISDDDKRQVKNKSKLKNTKDDNRQRVSDETKLGHADNDE